MIRVIYLLRHPSERQQILAASVAGLGFGIPRPGRSDNVQRVHDSDMVELAVDREGGWVRRVYDFGNRFVHLTDAHDYANHDPFQRLPRSEQTDIVGYLNQYHGGKVSGDPLTTDSSYLEIAAYAPHVLEKVTSNTRTYLEELRRTGSA